MQRLSARPHNVGSPAYFARHPIPRKPADLLRHECLMFRDPVSGRPFEWEFRRKADVVDVAANVPQTCRPSVVAA